MSNNELDFVAQTPRELTIAGHSLTVEPPTPYRFQKVMLAALALTVEAQRIDLVKETARSFAKNALDEAGGDPAKIDIDALKTKANDFIQQSIVEFMLAAGPAFAVVLSEIARPNKKGDKIPAPFDKTEFWLEEVTISEAATVLQTFVYLIDVSKLLKNVLALKGIV